MSSLSTPILAPAPHYEYTPLVSDGSTFRIAYLWPGIDEQPFECDFLEVPTSAQPNYSALSYAWGDPRVASFVWCHGQVIGIADSLRHALRSLRDQVHVRSFWIDALCINQQDDAGEKTMQIPLMRRIYQQSASVIIHLGKQQDGSQIIPALCNRVTRAYDRSHLNSHEAPGTQPVIEKENFCQLGLPHVDSDQWKTLAQFLGRPWFTRLWVIQEAALATSVEVICGLWSMNWNNLIPALIKAITLGIPFQTAQTVANKYGSVYTNASLSPSQLCFMNALGAGRAELVPWKCIDLLQSARLSLTSRAQDCCYGVLGLSKEFDHPDLKVDCSLPVEMVYRQFARYFVRHGDGIKLLYNAPGRGLDLPSWVPDWSYRDVPEPRIIPHPCEDEPAYATASFCPSYIRLDPQARDILVVRGLIFDHIEQLGVLHQLNRIRDRDKDQGVRSAHQRSPNDTSTPPRKRLKTTYDSDERLWRVEQSLLIANCITELCRLLHSGQRLDYPDGEFEERVVWKTLICNRTKVSSIKAPSYYANFFKDYLLAAGIIDPSWRMPHTLHRSRDPRDLAERTLSDIMTKADVIMDAARPFCLTRRHGITKRGYVGQFPLHAEACDLVFLPLGSAIPFIIRAGPNNTYKIIAECYIHGIMDGEAFDVADDGLQDIRIV